MIIYNSNFNIKQIAKSGQCFRMNEIEQNRYSLVAHDCYLELTQKDDEVIELSCGKDEYYRIWKEYFDMEYDYYQIVQTLTQGSDLFLKEAAVYGRGIRILRQDPFEAMISYIISQNKNIPAIKRCIESICRKYGQQRISKECENVTYYTFPTPDVLARANNEELIKLKTGYRDKYIISAAQAVAEGTIDLSYLKKCDLTQALQDLKSIHGVGDKVANCIALYGLHHIEVFPIDVWIKRVLFEIYNNEFDQRKYDGYAGIVQQYMFYYMRHLYEMNK